MKFATLKTGHPDGELVIVSDDNTKMVKVKSVPTMQYLMENWEAHREELKKIYDSLNQGKMDTFSVDEKKVSLSFTQSVSILGWFGLHPSYRVGQKSKRCGGSAGT